LRLRDLALVLLLGVLAPVAGLGLLYLLRNAGVAPIGPKPAGALPLQQLDGSDAQPLLRMALAWLPVGIAVGAVTAAFTRMPRTAALVVVAFVAAALLVVSGGVSDSIANNDPLTMHLAAPLSVAGTWVSIVLLVIGVAIGERLAVAAPRAPSAA
jgi:hypothetical protein